MIDPRNGIDHIVIVVHDLDIAREKYGRLGFTLSPKGQHSASMGTANHTIMLSHDYFEVLSVVAPTARNLLWRTALEHGEGIGGIALATVDIAATRDAWLERKLSPGEIIDFSRPVERPGAIIEARFETVSLPGETIPDTKLFTCRHLTPEAVWLPELLQHANTAFAMQKVTIASIDPDRDAAGWAAVLVESERSAVEDGVRLKVGGHVIDVVRSDAVCRRQQLSGLDRRTGAVAIKFAVKDINACRASLGRSNVPSTTEGDEIWVSPRDACGVGIGFAQF